MRTLAERLHFALKAKKKIDPQASQANLARWCGVRGPSVSDWFSGETKELKAETLLKASEYLNVMARWLLDGTGPIGADLASIERYIEEGEPTFGPPVPPESSHPRANLSPRALLIARAYQRASPEQQRRIEAALEFIGIKNIWD